MAVSLTHVGEQRYTLPCELNLSRKLQLSHMCDTLEIVYSSFSYLLKNLVSLVCIVGYLKWTINILSYRNVIHTSSLI